jgi:hypothetical protein
VRSALTGLLLALLMLAGCASSWRDEATPDVYVALIDESATRKSGDARTLAIARRTLECQDSWFDHAGLSEEWMPAVIDLKKRCSESRAVVDDFRRPHRMVANDDETAGVTDDHNAGMIELSPIGFDPGKTKAVVVVRHYCGGLCGSGSIVALRRTEAGWQKVKSTRLWWE